MEQITFTDTESGEENLLYVLEETTINEVRYLLVTDEDSEEANGYIFKEIAADEDNVTYEPVEDDDVYQALLKVFSELLEDTAFES